MAYPFIHYNNIDDTPAATSEATGFDVENMFDWRAYVTWKATGTATQYITMDAGSAVDVDALGIAGHNLGTVGATISVESSATGAWTGEEVERLAGFAQSDDSAILKPITSANARYWRVKITGASAAPEIGVLCLGERIDFPEYPERPLDYLNETPEGVESVSKGGQLLGAVARYRAYSFTLNFTYFPFAWLISTFDTFWDDHGRLRKPFFVHINSDEFTDGRFCRFPGSYAYRRQLQDLDYVTSISFPFEGIL